MLKSQTSVESFATYVDTAEPSLRKALIAGFGVEVGRDATADALVYGWENWERVRTMDNPTGYLFRVGQNAARRTKKRQTLPASAPSQQSDGAWYEPALSPALGRLSDRQRVIVALLHAFDFSMTEVAELLGIAKSTVQMHDARAMKKLRRDLGVQK
ncbi:MAG: sigma factor-like helix-turn-helix DNA-binding protein [Actinomycetota bacterium]|nr:sigma factor-like helix-turn-helix DNA-binding protein [Actinomycetota bacterium]